MSARTINLGHEIESKQVGYVTIVFLHVVGIAVPMEGKVITAREDSHFKGLKFPIAFFGKSSAVIQFIREGCRAVIDLCCADRILKHYGRIDLRFADYDTEILDLPYVQSAPQLHLE